MIPLQSILRTRDRHVVLFIFLIVLTVLLLPLSWIYHGSLFAFSVFAGSALALTLIPLFVNRPYRWLSIFVGCGYMIFANAIDSAIPGDLVAEYALFTLLACLLYARDPWYILTALAFYFLEVWVVPHTAIHLESLRGGNGAFFVAEGLILTWMSWMMRQDESTISENERYFRSIFEGATEAMAVFDHKGRYHAVNTAWEKLTGYSQQETLQPGFSPALWIENFNFQALLSQLDQHDEIYLERHFLHKATASMTEVRIAIKRLPKMTTWPEDRYLLIASDITVLKAKEKEMAELQAHWREVFEAAGEAVAIAYEEGDSIKIREVNSSFCTLLGYRKEELANFDIVHITPPEFLEKERRLIQEMMQKGQEIRYEKPHLRKDGSIVPTLVTIRPLSKQGWLVATLANLTVIKKAEEEIIVKERYWRSIFNGAGVGIMISNPNGDLLDMNPALTKILGYDEPLPPQKAFIQQMAPEKELPAMMEVIQKTYQGQETITQETMYRRRDGTFIPVILTRRAIDKNMHVLTVLDATELYKRRQEIERLSQSQKEVIEATATILEALLQGQFDRSSNYTIFQGEFAHFKTILEHFSSRLKTMLLALRQASGAVLRAAEEIASSSEHLSQRTEKRAAALEELSASMEEMSTSIEEAAKQAEEARKLAQTMEEKARVGQDNIDYLFETMQSITQGSGEIETMLELINEIAFQTNLLALNASVEAARAAGSHGAGFGVIAEEIRRLAQKSAASAKEISGKIASIKKAIAKGEEGASHLRTTYMEIADTIIKTATAVMTIAKANEEEARTVHQVNRALADFQDLSHQDASLVEENATAAASLRHQANALKRLAEFGIQEKEQLPNHKLNVDTPNVASLPRQTSKSNIKDEWEEF